MIFLLTPITLILIFYLIGNLFSKLLNLENTEKPIFALGFIVLVLNYGYFNLNLKIEIIFYFLSVLALAAIIFTIKSTNFDIKNNEVSKSKAIEVYILFFKFFSII